MLVKPKEYSDTYNYGGYLTNGIIETQELIIHKNLYKHNSIISQEHNYVFKAINNIAQCPFTINTQVLNFILKKGYDLGILLGDKKHKFEDIENKTYYQKTVYESYKSQLFNQTITLELALLYQYTHQIFFPIRIDQRGRIYCQSSYLNYQSTDLAKSLLLFAKPAFINTKDETSIEYLKIYGANCFGLDKNSINEKLS
jgi:DNA-directed RNA polymerase